MAENQFPSTDLPQDLILLHILPRLPAKTVVRLKIVCKQWLSFLNSRTFCDMHLHHLTKNRHQNDQKLLMTSRRIPRKLHSINCEAPHAGLTRLEVLFDSHADMFVLTSCDGMICIGMQKVFCDHEFADLILWNPLTSEYKTLSKTNSHKECYEVKGRVFKMYYTSCDDDYRLLRVTKSCNAYIYSLKLDSWRKIESTVQGLYRWMSSASWGENVYFLNDCQKKVFIIRFDTKTERFTKIVDESFRKQNLSSIIERDSCIQFFVRDISDDTFELLKMNEDGEWTKVETCLSKRSFNEYWHPLHLMRNGSWLMDYACFLIVININGDKSRPLNSHPLDDDDDLMRARSEGKYIETLVSPNRYM